MTHLTQAERDANTHAHLKAIAEGQKAKNDKRHADIVASSSWLQNVRATQIKLNQKGGN